MVNGCWHKGDSSISIRVLELDLGIGSGMHSGSEDRKEEPLTGEFKVVFSTRVALSDCNSANLKYYYTSSRDKLWEYWETHSFLRLYHKGLDHHRTLLLFPFMPHLHVPTECQVIKAGCSGGLESTDMDVALASRRRGSG